MPKPFVKTVMAGVSDEDDDNDLEEGEIKMGKVIHTKAVKSRGKSSDDDPDWQGGDLDSVLQPVVRNRNRGGKPVALSSLPAVPQVKPTLTHRAIPQIIVGPSLNVSRPPAAPKTSVMKTNVTNMQQMKTGVAVMSSVKKQATAETLTPGIVEPETYECPINEKNVECAIDQSIAVTTEMRTILATLKDDLKRAGGGANMTVNTKTAQVQRRREIAAQLVEAFVSYQSSINDIGEFDRLPPLDFSKGAWSMSEPGGRKRPLTTISSAGEPRGPYKKPSGIGESVHSPAADSPPVSPTPRRRRVPDVQPSEPAQVADDLWMLCEAGSEDEEDEIVGYIIPRVGR